MDCKTKWEVLPMWTYMDCSTEDGNKAIKVMVTRCDKKQRKALHRISLMPQNLNMCTLILVPVSSR